MNTVLSTIFSSGEGKTRATVEHVETIIGRNLKLAPAHNKRISELKEQGRYCNAEAKGLPRRSVSQIEDDIVKYAQNNIKDELQILALVIKMCSWISRDKERTPSFMHAKSVIDLLAGSFFLLYFDKSPYYRPALLIYQAALYENADEDPWALSTLFDLPIVSVNKEDDYHALSIFIKGHAYESTEKSNYRKAQEVYTEIGENDPEDYQRAAALAIVRVNGRAQAEKQ